MTMYIVVVRVSIYSAACDVDVNTAGLYYRSIDLAVELLLFLTGW